MGFHDGEQGILMSVEGDVVRNMGVGKSRSDIVYIGIGCSQDKSLSPYIIRSGG